MKLGRSGSVFIIKSHVDIPVDVMWMKAMFNAVHICVLIPCSA